MSYPKLTPIIAKGATEPRYLEDRFTDVVNVKDFGAKGDGVITSITSTPKPLVIVIAGQSNAIGCAPEADATYSVSSCKFWNGMNSTWISPVANPVWNSSTGGFIPSLAYYLDFQKKRPVYFINVAVGDTICATQTIAPHAGTWASTGSLRTRAKTIVDAALESINVSYDFLGTIWLQGESDVVAIENGNETIDDFSDSLADTISWFVNDENIGGEFFAVSIAYNSTSSYDDTVDSVNSAIESAVSGNDKAHLVSSITKSFRDNGHLADTYHYTSKGYNDLGRSIALGLTSFIESNVKVYSGTFSGTDDTDAWNRWQTVLESGGIGYVPSGIYLVSGFALAFKDGCFGNCQQWKMTGNPAPNDLYFLSDATKTGPIIQYHRDFSGIESWSPLIDLSFDSISDRTSSWTVNGAGAQGIQVRGTLRGNGNSHPTGIRSLMLNELNGDGDCVALWGRCHKQDPVGGTNNSDTCAIHASCEVSGSGTGICMATEHWAHCLKEQGAQGTNYNSFFEPGGIVCQHIGAMGDAGMVQSALLINNGAAERYPYGAWSAININSNVCRFDGSTRYPANTAFIKSPNISGTACPEAFLFMGWCPKHVKINGGYDYNVSANWMRKFNATVDASSMISITDQRMEDSDEAATPYIGIQLQEKGYSGIAHAPNVNVYDSSENLLNPSVTYFDLYHVRGGVNTFYRAQNQNTTHHVFYATDSSGQLGEVLNIWHSTVRPGRDNSQQLGDSTTRWSTVFAGTGTINTSDERVKDNIEQPSEALMRAWGKVNFKVFQMKDAITEKGVEVARLHVGVIAQQVMSAFEEEGLDAARYGLFCHDEWEAEEPKIQRHWIEDEMEQRDENGNLIAEARGHYVEFVESPGREAGDLYSIRYDEALALECAYQRWRLEQLEERINQLTNSNN